MTHILHLVRSLSRLVAASTAALALTGCGAMVSNAPTSQVRVVTASPDAPNLDIYQGSNALAHNLGFGSVTSYMPLSPGVDTIAANNAGTKQLLSQSKISFAASGHYTVLIGNVFGGMQQLTLTDQNQPAPSGQTALRFVNQATRLSAVDIYLVPAGQKLLTTTPLVTNTGFGANTGYLNIPAGTYSLVMLSAGTLHPDPSLALYSGPHVTYSAGAARTVILIDQQLPSTPGLQVIAANDFDPVTN